MSEYTGKDVSYYLVTIHKPKRLAPYTAECEDIIEALGMSFAEGCAFKAIWRKCAARTLGLAKAGYKGGLYDAEKAQYYGARMVAAEQPVSCSHCGVSEGSLHHPDCHLMRQGKSRLAGVYSEIVRNAHQLAAVMTGPCSECGFPQNHDGTHYATCSMLSAPAEHIEQAEAAFEEAVGSPGHTIRPPKEVLVEVSDAWRRANTAEPATPVVHNEMDEERVDIVASSHAWRW